MVFPAPAWLVIWIHRCETIAVGAFEAKYTHSWSQSDPQPELDGQAREPGEPGEAGSQGVRSEPVPGMMSVACAWRPIQCGRRRPSTEFIEGDDSPIHMRGSAVYGSQRNVNAMNGIFVWQTQSQNPLWALIIGWDGLETDRTGTHRYISTVDIPVVTFLTPLAEHSSDPKNR